MLWPLALLTIYFSSSVYIFFASSRVLTGNKWHTQSKKLMSLAKWLLMTGQTGFGETINNGAAFQGLSLHSPRPQVSREGTISGIQKTWSWGEHHPMRTLLEGDRQPTASEREGAQGSLLNLSPLWPIPTGSPPATDEVHTLSLPGCRAGWESVESGCGGASG